MPIVNQDSQDARVPEENITIAVRNIYEVVAGSVTIRLPVDFAAKRVEVIVLPVEEAPPEPSRLQRLLLAAPTISEAELDEFARTRE